MSLNVSASQHHWMIRGNFESSLRLFTNRIRAARLPLFCLAWCTWCWAPLRQSRTSCCLPVILRLPANGTPCAALLHVFCHYWSNIALSVLTTLYQQAALSHSAAAALLYASGMQSSGRCGASCWPTV